MITKNDIQTAYKVLDYMIAGKREQIGIEPNEPMWTDELRQLLGAKELIEMDEESILG